MSDDYAEPQLAYTVTERVFGTRTTRVFGVSALDAERRWKAGEGEEVDCELAPKGGPRVSRNPANDRVAEAA